MNTKSNDKLSYPCSNTPECANGVEIFPGIHWLRLPLPFDLDHINLWLLQDGDAYTLIDTGVCAAKTREAWEILFKDYLHDKPVKRIIVTHYHPDHIGLIQWLSERFCPELLMSQQCYERTNYLLTEHDDAHKNSIADFYHGHGIDDTNPFVDFCTGYNYRQIISGLPKTYSVITDQQIIMIGGRAWRSIMAEGHAEGHLSFYCEDLQLLISGDQVLPSISTNISVHANGPRVDNLGLYLSSFDFFRALPEQCTVLPSHGRVFQGLHERLAQLQRHHEQQLERVYSFCESPSTVKQVFPLMFGRKLNGLNEILGFGEALAHLLHLERKGKLECAEEGGRKRFMQK